MTNYSALKKGENFITIGGLLILSILLGLYIASERVDSFEVTARVQVAQQEAVSLNRLSKIVQ
jgi:hypothetical protein